MSERVDVTFRGATLADSSAIVSVIHAAFEEYRGRLDPPSGAHAETIESIAEKLSTGHGILASVDGNIAGCVLCEFGDDHLYLGRLAVLPEYRRGGIGRELVAHAEKEARAHGYKRMRLGVRVPLGDNQAFFKRLGYRVVEYEHHPGHAEPTYVSMEKEV